MSKRKKAPKQVSIRAEGGTSSDEFVRRRSLPRNPKLRVNLSETDAIFISLRDRRARCMHFANEKAINVYWNQQLRRFWHLREEYTIRMEEALHHGDRKRRDELHRMRMQTMGELSHQEQLMATCAIENNLPNPALLYPYESYGEYAPVAK